MTSGRSAPSRPGTRDRARGTAGTPQVSVVVACYNDAANLPVAVASILDQSLADIEVIICDDASTDDTGQVAAGLCDADVRVRYERLAHTSGSAAEPRNVGLRESRAPWITFVDSDDELAPQALERLLGAARRAGAHVAAGRISRLHVADGRWTGWCTRLFERTTTIESIRAEPERLYDTAAVGKLYDRGFLIDSGLAFEPGLLYEDCLWTAQVYATARRLAVIPDLVYVWKVHEAAERLSVTNDRQSLRNVRGRLRANAAIDRWLADSGSRDLLPAKQEKFLRHDLGLYLGDLVSADDRWARTVVEEFRDYVLQTPRRVIEGLPTLHRLGIAMLERQDLDGVRRVYRAILRGEFATDLIAVDGRELWSGRLVADDPGRVAELDVSALHIGRRPFLQLRLAHDLRAWRMVAGGDIEVRIRTWNPLGAIDVAEARMWVELAPRRRSGVTERFPGQLRSTGDSWIEWSVLLDRRPVERDPDDDRLVLEAIVQVRALDNVGALPFPGSGLGTDPVPGSPDPLGWVAPVRAQDGGLALRHRGTPAATPGQPAAQPRTRSRLVARRAGDALGKRVRRRVGPAVAVFCADDGRSYSGNPKYLYEELLRTGWPGEAIWVRGRGARGFPDGVETVAKGSRQYYLALGGASYWVCDTDVPAHVSKPRGTRSLHARDSYRTVGRWPGGPHATGHRPTGPGRWDFTLAAPGDPGRPGSRSTAQWARSLAGLGTPRLDHLAGAEPKGPGDLRAAGLPPDAGGLDVLIVPPSDRGATAGLPWSPDVAGGLIAGLGRLLFAPRPADRWRVPDDLGHVLVDIGRVPDATVALRASDVLVTGKLAAVREWVLLDRPVILLHGAEAGPQGPPSILAPGPVARSADQLAQLLTSRGALRSDQHAAVRRDLRAQWFPAEDGRASGRVVRAVFGQGP